MARNKKNDDAGERGAPKWASAREAEHYCDWAPSYGLRTRAADRQSIKLDTLEQLSAGTANRRKWPDASARVAED